MLSTYKFPELQGGIVVLECVEGGGENVSGGSDGPHCLSPCGLFHRADPLPGHQLLPLPIVTPKSYLQVQI